MCEKLEKISNESIAEYQIQQQRDYINKIKNEIIEDLKRYISENPYITELKYYKYEFEYGFNGYLNNLSVLLSKYDKIDKNFKEIKEELKKENIKINYMEEYKTTYTGLFKKKQKRELDRQYYLITWNMKEEI
ncbi:UNVERIFIED_ORG: hypothetical protein B2H93_16755 [Clostridium botulinum]